ncbi:AI-2E family transporter [Heyndrickxia sp. NPDC080065]|uniref:AI-2E family transporter n=1 Tax=Heyndrickxia sp. NPDC080065 TaxID=3390568 RepID=UPI003CFF1DC7
MFKIKKKLLHLGIGIIIVLIIIYLLNQVSFVFTPLVIFIQTLFIPFLISGILYYLARPIVKLLEGWKIPRKLAIMLIFVMLIGVIVTVVELVGPLLQDQFKRLVENVPDMVKAGQDAFDYWQKNQEYIPQFAKDIIANVTAKLQTNALSTGAIVAKTLSNVFGFIFSLVIVPFILFYMLNDRDRFVPNVTRFFPKSKEKEIRSVLHDMDKALGGYIQGQLIVSSVVGILLLIGYLIIGLDYALILALFGMATNVIPFLGPFIAATPAIIVAFFQDPIMAVYVVIVMFVAQQIESNFVSPQVMGKTLNVHPLTIILLILVGGNLAGVLGMILIIPTYAVLKVVVLHIYQLFRIRKVEE